MKAQSQYRLAAWIVGCVAAAAYPAPMPPLHAAAQHGDAARVAELLQADPAAVAQVDGHGRTALHVAVLAGKTEMVGVLLAAGADVNVRDAEQSMSLHVAVKELDQAIVQNLVEHKADVMAADAQGSTALHLLAKAGTPAARDAEAREKLARLLIGAGADVGAADREGSRPLHLAAVKNRVELTALLLGAGADVAARDQYGRQALHWAAMGGFAEFMKTLVDAGADVAAADSAGDVPLHYAARRGQVDATKLLLSRGALSDVRNRGELTPLLAVASAPGGHRGIDENLISVAELLLDAGADVAARGPAGQDAVQMARDAEHDRLAAFLERLMPRSEGR